MTFGSLIKRVLRPLINWYRAVVTPDTRPSSPSSSESPFPEESPQEDNSAGEIGVPKIYFASDDEITVTQVIDSNMDSSDASEEAMPNVPASDDSAPEDPMPEDPMPKEPMPEDPTPEINQVEAPPSGVDAEAIADENADTEKSGVGEDADQVVYQAASVLEDEGIEIDTPSANNVSVQIADSVNDAEAADSDIHHYSEETPAEESAEITNTTLDKTNKVLLREGDANKQAGQGIVSSEPTADSVDLVGERSAEAPESGAPINDDVDAVSEDAVSKDAASEDTDHEVAEADEEKQALSGEPPQPLRLLQFDDQPVTLLTLVESLLFVAETAAEPKQFAEVLDVPLEDVQAALDKLSDDYVERGSGIRLQDRDGKYTLVSMPLAAQPIEDFLNLDLNSRLSSAALEALAIVAYRQPVTRVQVESVRGVDCGGVLRTLLQRELITEVGRLDAVGRPILYGVTDLFMQHFGLTTMDELPSLETTDADLLWAATQLADDDDNEDTNDEDTNDIDGADDSGGIDDNDDASDSDKSRKEVNSHE